MLAEWRREWEDLAPLHVAETYMRDATPAQLIRMWETGKDLERQPLTNEMFEALVCAWEERFGGRPPLKRKAVDGPLPLPSKREAASEQQDGPPIDDNTILRMADVTLAVGLSKSTINRLVARGRFPAPVRLSTRRIGWVGAEVRAWRKQREEQRASSATRGNRR